MLKQNRIQNRGSESDERPEPEGRAPWIRIAGNVVLNEYSTHATG